MYGSLVTSIYLIFQPGLGTRNKVRGLRLAFLECKPRKLLEINLKELVFGESSKSVDKPNCAEDTEAGEEEGLSILLPHYQAIFYSISLARTIHLGQMFSKFVAFHLFIWCEIGSYKHPSGSDLLCSLKLLRKAAFFTARDETLTLISRFFEGSLLRSLTGSSTVVSTFKISLKTLETCIISWAFLSVGVSDVHSGIPCIIKFNFLSSLSLSSFNKEVRNWWCDNRDI